MSVEPARMRILTVVSTFEPHSYGGGEVSAQNLTAWLKSRGYVTGIATTTDREGEETEGLATNYGDLWRQRYPRSYTYWRHASASKWKKPLWYLQDHFDPRNGSTFRRVLKGFEPDCILLHVASGLGYNIADEIARRDVPTIYFLHDQNLACLFGGFHKHERNCAGQCWHCKISSAIRYGYVSRIPRLSFCSPSQANLDLVAKYTPIGRHLCRTVLNVNTYPAPDCAASPPSDKLRLLYVGRLHSTKGIDILIDAVESLAAQHPITLTIVGDGPDRKKLEQRCRGLPWCELTGQVSLQEVSNHMRRSDLLCVPSIWAENSPGVVIHALSQGLPVLGTRVGGIPELVQNGSNGALVAPSLAGWKEKLSELAQDRSSIAAWQGNAIAGAHRFDPDTNGRKLEELIAETVKPSRA